MDNTVLRGEKAAILTSIANNNLFALQIVNTYPVYVVYLFAFFQEKELPQKTGEDVLFKTLFFFLSARQFVAMFTRAFVDVRVVEASDDRVQVA